MSFLFNIRDATYKWIGIGFILFGILLVAASAPHYNIPEDKYFFDVFMGVCSPAFFVIGALMLLWGMRAEKERKDFEKLAGFLKAYRRIKIQALAKKLALSEYETERRILKCVRLGILTGFIDRATDEFFNPQGMEGKALISCPNCGGPVEQLVLAGETGKCPYCQSMLNPKT
jgi:hypothetical protein